MANTEPDGANEKVLRVLYQAGVGISAGAIVANLDALVDADVSESKAERVLEDLEADNLVRRLDEPEDYYLVTDRGRNYVEAEIDQDGIGFID